ncbi:Similar to Ppm1e: Protein phosphatase 1E (Rattus norvegicus) [Cotesia congregata]|uniref:Similar to Ppm1e: Protein phosphatase 1E (Rattus norvegicus) n=1 Tax=Cotesia congregata TaxID=51543 RepID=A0A8J2MK33_COTCN|nr:Similar to Ppm1e: Protein phosphatase 1E (Rattus norvegicus) [Cotesia congregata]
MGGLVLHYGMWRVNGDLAVSRAIGDPKYKPYVTSEPEMYSGDLDGTEDFLIIACDGLWDYVNEVTAAKLVYEQISRDCQKFAST